MTHKVCWQVMLSVMTDILSTVGGAALDRNLHFLHLPLVQCATHPDTQVGPIASWDLLVYGRLTVDLNAFLFELILLFIHFCQDMTAEHNG